MGLVCEFDIINDVFGIDATSRLGIEIDYSEACEAFVETFFNEAYNMVPVDTGALRRSINAYTDGYSYIRAEASEDYAQYVEFGTYKMSPQEYFVPACKKAWHDMIVLGREAIELAQEEEDAEIGALEKDAAEEEAEIRAEAAATGPRVEREVTNDALSQGFSPGAAHQLGAIQGAMAAALAAALATIMIALIQGFLSLITEEKGGMTTKEALNNMEDTTVEQFIYVD